MRFLSRHLDTPRSGTGVVRTPDLAGIFGPTGYSGLQVANLGHLPVDTELLFSVTMSKAFGNFAALAQAFSRQLAAQTRYSLKIKYRSNRLEGVSPLVPSAGGSCFELLQHTVKVRIAWLGILPTGCALSCNAGRHRARWRPNLCKLWPTLCALHFRGLLAFLSSPNQLAFLNSRSSSTPKS